MSILSLVYFILQALAGLSVISLSLLIFLGYHEVKYFTDRKRQEALEPYFMFAAIYIFFFAFIVVSVYFVDIFRNGLPF